jgi:predicted RNA-binding Zn-ribbon protein involved in translation (DUF1610 family)
MIYDNNKKEFVFIGEVMTSQDVENMTLKVKDGLSSKEQAVVRKLFYDDLQNLLTNQSTPDDVCVYENTLIYCPVCGVEDEFTQWKEAYYNPLTYFDSEKLCRVCGGEVIENLTKKSQKGIASYKCEDCGFEEEEKVEVAQ